MILGMSIEAFTRFHVILSLIGVGSGLVVMRGMLAASSARGGPPAFSSLKEAARSLLEPRDRSRNTSTAREATFVNEASRAVRLRELAGRQRA